MKIHLKDEELQFFMTIPEITSGDLELKLQTLKDHFHKTNVKEIHLIELENLKYDSKTETPEEFLVKFQKLAKLAY